LEQKKIQNSEFAQNNQSTPSQHRRQFTPTTQKKTQTRMTLRPRSDPYIPITVLTSMTTANVNNHCKIYNGNRETKSFDDLTATGSSSSPCSYSLDENEGNQRRLFVRNCKNCSYAFRVKRSLSNSSGSSSVNDSPPRKTIRNSSSSSSPTDEEEFCCKDCETCFTLFSSGSLNNNSPTPNKPVVKQSTFDVRQSIYAFQRELLSNDTTTPKKTEEASGNPEIKDPPVNDPQNDEKELIQAAKKKFDLQYFQGVQKQQSLFTKHPLLPENQPHSNYNNANNNYNIHVNTNNMFGWFFQQPKPMRPQLHAFI
jgi:hypothetical protein